MTQAVQEGDPDRLITLFESCASKGDGRCQTELAAGLSILARDDRIGKRPQLQPRYFLGWYRAALNSTDWQRVSMATFASFYGHGIHDFPKNTQLSRCWWLAAIGPTTAEREKRMDNCKTLERQLLGNKIP